MNVSKLLACRFFLRTPSSLSRRASRVNSPLEEKYFPQIGNRQIVGYGRNGNLQYLDDLAYPYPSIRFRQQTDEIEPLLEKEKGNWCDLTLEEKKTLYRHSFRMTLAELLAPNPQWKLAVAWATFIMAGSLLYYTYLKVIVLDLPSMRYREKDYKEALLYKRLYSRDGPIDGLVSAFDFENMRWK